MATLKHDIDPRHERTLRVRWPVWLECQSEAARSLGNAICKVNSFLTELDDVYGNDTFAEEREECSRLIAAVLGKIMSTAESAFQFVTAVVPDVEDESKREAARAMTGSVEKAESVPLEFGIDRNGDEVVLWPAKVFTGSNVACECEWSDQPWHDLLVSIEGAGPYWTAELISSMVATVDGDTGPMSGVAPNDFEAFVAEHNWNDPRQMAWLARNIQYIYKCGRRS